MTFYEYRCTLLTIVLGFLVLNVTARSWDLAVVIGREIEFFARNKTLTGKTQIAEAVALSGVAYDDITRTMYLSDTRNNVSIFSDDLTEKNFTSTPLLNRQEHSYILDIVFDAATRTLFWSDALKEVIMKMHVPLDRPPEEPTVLHDLTNRSPRGIALDVCNSHVYWVNSNNTNPSVERSNLDGSDRITIVKENLYEPLAVAIDHAEGKLYWIDDVEGIKIKIERSNLDGSQRELVVNGKQQQPVYLAVDHESLYWTDFVYRAVWTISKNAKAGDMPTIFKSYYVPDQEADPAGIVTRDNSGKIDCDAIAKMGKRTNASKPISTFHAIESFNNLTTSTEESELTTETSKHCLNNGQLEKDGSCRCKIGYSGAYCEISLCHNYCLRGSCSISNHGLPECECPSAFIGARCQKNVCEDYCLHDGECTVQNGKPTCKCKNSTGHRCEETSIDVGEVCAMFCAGNETGVINFDASSCRCNEMNESTAKMVKLNVDVKYGPLLPIFGALIGVLVLLIAVLSYYVNKLRRRPRIKKRFVVSKGGVTPLTSRPQIPDNQCEITIENCCNMNICETPCFEPKLRNAGPRSNGTKKEEKNSLLDNMEGNPC